MAKLQWMKWYPADWLTSTRQLSPEAKGCWMDILMLMWNSPERGRWEGTHQEFARATGLAWELAPAVVRELARDVATATFSDAHVTLENRRMRKHQTAYEYKLNRYKRYRDKHKSDAKATHKTPIDSSRLLKNTPEEAAEVGEILSYFNTTCNTSLTLTADRRSLISRRLKEGRKVSELRAAILNFSKDTWVDRRKYMDLVYAIGVRNKIDNLERWLNTPLIAKEKSDVGTFS